MILVQTIQQFYVNLWYTKIENVYILGNMYWICWLRNDTCKAKSNAFIPFMKDFRIILTNGVNYHCKGLFTPTENGSEGEKDQIENDHRQK